MTDLLAELDLLHYKAYRTAVHGIVSIVFATSRGKARNATVLAARDAGYRTEFTEVQVHRAQELDGARGLGGGIPAANTCLGEDRLVPAHQGAG